MTQTPYSVYGVNNMATDCWANHFPNPPFDYWKEDCYANGFDFNCPSRVYIQQKGEYSHYLFPPFGHWTTAKAEGTITHYLATCRGGSLPIGPSDLECELDSGPVD